MSMDEAQFVAALRQAFPVYRVYRHKQTQIDYLYNPGTFRTIWSPDHYFFLAYGGLITTPHGEAQQVETNWLEFARDDAAKSAAAPAAIEPIIYPAEARTAGVRDWPDGYAVPDEETLARVRAWAVEAGIDRRGRDEGEQG